LVAMSIAQNVILVIILVEEVAHLAALHFQIVQLVAQVNTYLVNLDILYIKLNVLFILK